MILGQEGCAWLVYSILYGLLSIVLCINSISHRYNIPLAFFSVFMTVGHLYVALTPYFSQSDISWRRQEPAVNLLPPLSLLAFVGLINWQWMYTKFITTALDNHRRWESLYTFNAIDEDESTASDESSIITLVVTNIRAKEDSNIHTFTESSISCRVWIYYISMNTIYALATLTFLICKTTITDPSTSTLISAICVTVGMFLPSLFNSIYYACTKRCFHLTKTLGIMRQDAMILSMLPLLFMLAMLSITVLSWFAYKATTDHLLSKPFVESGLVTDNTKWILLKSFSIYLPLFLMLICCSIKGKKKKPSPGSPQL